MGPLRCTAQCIINGRRTSRPPLLEGRGIATPACVGHVLGRSATRWYAAFPRPGTFGFCPVSDEVVGRCGRQRGTSVCWRVRADPAEHGEGAGAEKRGGGSVTLPRRASPTGSSPGGGGVAGGESDVPSPPKSGGRGRSPRRARRPGGVSREPGGPGGGARGRGGRGTGSAAGTGRGPGGATRSGGGGRLRAPRGSPWASLGGF
ncbi:hypothetical protein Bbelb_072420 [Branchiostoma belcheri]|nr:hypothetical protein Bbelb_072420 [Branchiostoma belcheri]